MELRLRRDYVARHVGQYIIQITLADRVDIITAVDQYKYETHRDMGILFDDLKMLVKIMEGPMLNVFDWSDILSSQTSDSRYTKYERAVRLSKLLKIPMMSGNKMDTGLSKFVVFFREYGSSSKVPVHMGIKSRDAYVWYTVESLSRLDMPLSLYPRDTIIV